MFSLIITIISIALVAALALATLYYGGKAFNKSDANANAAMVLAQIQQIQGAISLYQTTSSILPTLSQLNETDHLKSTPQFKNVSWTDMTTGGGVYWLKEAVSKEACELINQKIVNTKTIPETPYSNSMASCFGSATNSKFNVIYSGKSTNLVNVLTTAQTAGQDVSGQVISSNLLLPLTALSTEKSTNNITLKAMSKDVFQTVFPFEIYKSQSLTATISVPVSELGTTVQIPMKLTTKPSMYSIDGLWDSDYITYNESINYSQWTRVVNDADFSGASNTSAWAQLDRINDDNFVLTVASNASDAQFAKNGVVDYLYVFGRADDYHYNIWYEERPDQNGIWSPSPSCALPRITLTSSNGSLIQQECTAP